MRTRINGRAGFVGVGIVSALTFLGTGTAIATPAADTPPDGYVPANIRVAKAATAYWGAHPGDYVGLNREIVRVGGMPVRFSFDKAGLADLPPETAQELYDRAKRSSGAAPSGPSTALDPTIPLSSFQVSGYWSRVRDQYGDWVTYFGNWQFGSGTTGDDPYDAMAATTADVPKNGCWGFDADGGYSFGINGTPFEDQHMARRGVDWDNTVWSVDDSSWGLGVIDRGTIWISYQRLPRPDPKIVPWCGMIAHASAHYIHNVDGCRCTWSYSVGMGGLSMSYSQTDEPVELQKSTTLSEMFVEG